MSIRLHSAQVIAKRKIFETVISPGFYIALALSLLTSYFLINGFVHSIDSSGFNFSLNPLYTAVGKTLAGAFGDVMIEKLFLEGPFLLVLYIYLFPVLVFLSFSSAFRFGLEKKVGAVELVSYGPSDGASYFLAVYLKDLLFALVSIVVLFFVSLAASSANNLVLGPQFLFSLITAFFVSSVVFGYGIFAASVTENGGSAVILFLAVISFFFVILTGSLSVAGGYVRTLFSTFSSVLQWISPFYYWSICARAVETGDPLLYGVGLVLLAGLSVLLLFISHKILQAKGVRS
jgi:hypothetical protein